MTTPNLTQTPTTPKMCSRKKRLRGSVEHVVQLPPIFDFTLTGTIHELLEARVIPPVGLLGVSLQLPALAVGIFERRAAVDVLQDPPERRAA